MTALTCYVADFNLVPSLPVVTDLTLKGKPLGSYFRDASGAGAIDVRLDFSRRGKLPGLIDPLGVGPEQLMDGLNRLLSAGPVTQPCAGLLIADTCAPAPGQFGLMFDLDGQDAGLGPRQGCAIFLTAIAQALPGGFDDPGARDFIAFIATHEIGHAFNLWHVDDASIMQLHPAPGNPGNYAFDAAQAHFLSLAGDAASARFVLPGTGCAAYGTRPAGFPAGDSEPPFASPPAVGPRLRIGLSNESFWSFEPVELDVTLSLPKSSRRAARVPDELDPGYPGFQIWITRPDGTRFRYRPAVRYCGHNGTRQIRPDRAFVRDIAITRQSHGYTFTAPGQYGIQAAFRLANGRFILSNKVECEVKAPALKSARWAHAAGLLDTHEAQRLFRYKRRLPPHATHVRMLDFVGRHASKATAAAIHYAVGRAAAATEPTSTGSHATLLRDGGIVHLRKAAESDGLGKHRKAIALRLIEKLSNGSC